MTTDKYILNEEGDPVLEPDLLKWAEQFEKTDRHVLFDKLPDGVKVSTIFLGLDHNWGEGPPILWETMIFGGPHDGYQERYMSKSEAIKGHLHALRLAETAQPAMREE